VVEFVAGRVTTSATAGNIEPDAALLQHAMARIAATGVDIVKAGLFPQGWATGANRDYAGVRRCLAGLDALPGTQRIAVMFADLAPPLDLVDAVADAGFDGVMVDTALKQGRSLCDAATTEWLAAFVARARGRGLLCGLAGSLRLAHRPACATRSRLPRFPRGALRTGRAGRSARSGSRHAHQAAIDDPDAVRRGGVIGPDRRPPGCAGCVR
jgi:uncharacterized protein (UPF0264 family)